VQDYILLRDYLLANIVLANANRSGVLSNMLVSDILDAREVDNWELVKRVPVKTVLGKNGPVKRVQVIILT